jgi:mevalonate kinase
MKIVVSVPGKVILMGEHAVVYGKPALIAAINKRLTVSLKDASSFNIKAVEGEAYIRYCIDIVCKHFQINFLPKVSVEISSDIPIGAHLGSSAALSAGIVGAFSFYFKKIWNPQLINQLAYECEKKIHVNSSGVDPAAVVSGGLIWYRRELEFLRSIWQMQFSIPKSLNHFYLVDSGRPLESTGEMVEFVRLQFTGHSSRYKKIFDDNEIQTKNIAGALKESNTADLIGAMRKGERTLEAMGVVGKKVQPLLRLIEKNDGAAKILGGGGRKNGVGFILVYHHDINALTSIIKPFGYPVQSVTLGAAGIKLVEKA